MKNSLFMSLLFVLTFWSSYSSAGYVDDQVLKYCKAFMEKHDDSVHEFAIEDVSKILGAYDQWKCHARSTEKNKVYTVHVDGRTLSATLSKSEQAKEYNTVSSRHTQSVFIPVGALEYTSMFGLKKHILYIAITKIQERSGVDQIYRLND